MLCAVCLENWISIDQQEVVTMKGRMACEISSGHELLLTEFVFQNMFQGLSADNIIGSLSCFCVDEKTDDTGLLDPELQKSFAACQDIAKTMAESMKQCEVEM